MKQWENGPNSGRMSSFRISDRNTVTYIKLATQKNEKMRVIGTEKMTLHSYVRSHDLLTLNQTQPDMMISRNQLRGGVAPETRYRVHA